MNIVVCVKQIPDPANPGKLDPETKTLVREGKLIMDDSDAYGVEMALQLIDKAGGRESFEAWLAGLRRFSRECRFQEFFRVESTALAPAA